MTKQDWVLKRSKLDMNYIEAKNNIDMLYAFKNNPVKIRDIITDGSIRIKVEKITLAKRATTDDVPECLYYGPRVTVRNKLYKSNTYASLTQSESYRAY